MLGRCMLTSMSKGHLLLCLSCYSRTPLTRVPGATFHSLSKIGNREVVGFGMNGEYSYIDRVDYPFPAIRFKKSSPDIMALREKERGDWRKLSMAEKKCLYRSSFCETFKEMNAPDSEWKSVFGWTLIFVSAAIWIWISVLLSYPVAPATFSRENRIEQYYRQVGINNQPITGNYRPPGAELRHHLAERDEPESKEEK